MPVPIRCRIDHHRDRYVAPYKMDHKGNEAKADRQAGPPAEGEPPATKDDGAAAEPLPFKDRIVNAQSSPYLKRI